jgi:hypothetical protein
VDDLRARIAEALNTTAAGFMQAEPDGVEHHTRHEWHRHEWHRHDRHRYNATCALCRGEEDTLTDAVMKVVQPELDRLSAEVAAAEETAADRQQNALHWQERAERAEAALARHADCTVCGHERHQHSTGLIRADYCTACPTSHDLHTFQDALNGPEINPVQLNTTTKE